MRTATDILLLVAEPERSQFESDVKQFASKHSFPFEWLLFIMDFETGHTLSPSITNYAGYVGLIQFGAGAMQTLNVTREELKSLSQLQQLQYVFKYFEYWFNVLNISSFKNIADLYLIVLYPKYAKAQDATPLVMPQQASVLYSGGVISKNSINSFFNSNYYYNKTRSFFRQHIFLIATITALCLTIVTYFLLRKKR